MPERCGGVYDRSIRVSILESWTIQTADLSQMEQDAFFFFLACLFTRLSFGICERGLEHDVLFSPNKHLPLNAIQGLGLEVGFK